MITITSTTFLKKTKQKRTVINELLQENFFLHWLVAGTNWRMWQPQCLTWWAKRRRQKTRSARWSIRFFRCHPLVCVCVCVCVCQVVWNLGKRKSSANCKFSGDGWQWWWIGERHHRHLPHANHHHHHHHHINIIRTFRVCPRWPSRSSWPTAWPGPQFSTTRPHLGSFWLDSANLLSKWLRVNSGH